MSQTVDPIPNIDELKSTVTTKTDNLDHKRTLNEQYRYDIDRAKILLCNIRSKFVNLPVLAKCMYYPGQTNKQYQHYVEHTIFIQWKMFFDSLISSFDENINEEFFDDIDKNTINLFLIIHELIYAFKNLLCQFIYDKNFQSEIYMQNWKNSTKNYLEDFCTNVEKIKKTDLFCYLYIFCINIDIVLNTYISNKF
ncbi:hypothetical protein COBT_002787 [Conglomerata obtusa]